MLKLLSVISGFILLANNLHGQSDTLNFTDAEGKKQGFWIISGKMKPEKGFCDSCRYEAGIYKDDRKNGVWSKYHKNGHERLIGMYKNNRPNGDYQKFYSSGQLMEVGKFIGGRQKEVYIRYNESGCIAVQKFYNDEGKEDGCVSYYFDDCDTLISLKGTIQFEFEKENGIVEGNRRQPPHGWGSGTGCGIKYVVDYDSTNLANLYRDRMGWSHTYNDCEEVEFEGKMKEGKPWTGKKYVYNEECAYLFLETWLEGEVSDTIYPPSLSFGVARDQKKVKPNGYNKLYNKDDEIVLDGEFKNDLLYNGKYYKYDSDGILLKVEIWKNGKYHSDGVL
ncbi:MAG: antitoxin component YwqK of YwqJK toxin-antitoxin module [Arenicella sp.]|jgi:antitoxin component YwqK of YwqJK toxin-antitoxin module